MKGKTTLSIFAPVLRAAACIAFFSFAISFPAVAGDSGLQWSAANFENGDRLVTTYHLKIEHVGKSPIDIFVHEAGSKEAKQLVAGAAKALGLDAGVSTVISILWPLPTFAYQETEQKKLFSGPEGYTVCKAGAVGNIEASRAHWTAKLVRDQNMNGLYSSTAVGTDKHDTHRVEGTFYVEFVKPAPGWETKYGCMASGTIIWEK